MRPKPPRRCPAFRLPACRSGGRCRASSAGESVRAVRAASLAQAARDEPSDVFQRIGGRAGRERERDSGFGERCGGRRRQGAGAEGLERRFVRLGSRRGRRRGRERVEGEQDACARGFQLLDHRVGFGAAVEDRDDAELAADAPARARSPARRSPARPAGASSRRPQAEAPEARGSQRGGAVRRGSWRRRRVGPPASGRRRAPAASPRAGP